MRVFLLFTLIVSGCSGQQLQVDSSTEAFKAGEYALVNACQSAPSEGFDACRFTVGDEIKSSWTLIAPSQKTSKYVTGGTVDVYFKDLHKSYPVGDWLTEIKLGDFLGAKTWTKDYHQGLITALLTLNWTDNEGIAQVSRYRGVALLLVTDKGYSRMPIDSGNAFWEATCRIQYSTAGRSAMSCK